MAPINNPTAPKTLVDLHGIALLLKYEYGTTELIPQVARGCYYRLPESRDAVVPRTGLVYRPPKGSSLESEPGLPSNMVPRGASERLRNADAKTLENLFWRARDHDGCNRTIVLFQYLMDLFGDEKEAILRVRAVDNDAPRVFDTPVSGTCLDKIP